MFLDPGRKSLFTAVVGVASAKQIRKFFVKEYYHLTGSTVYSKKTRVKKKSVLASRRSSPKFPHQKQQQLDHTINMLNTC
jgi:hypothetical protein